MEGGGGARGLIQRVGLLKPAALKPASLIRLAWSSYNEVGFVKPTSLKPSTH